MTVDSQQAKRLLRKNINRALRDKGWSRYRLALNSGMTEQTIANICNGKYEPRISVLKTLANSLGLGVDDLLKENSKILANVG